MFKNIKLADSVFAGVSVDALWMTELTVAKVRSGLHQVAVTLTA